MRSSTLFIAIEGIEGSGKSSLQRGLSTELCKRGIDVLLTREPGGTPLGLSIRSLLLANEETPSQKAELLLFAADRAEHVAKVITPAIQAGKTVICDRFLFSTIAYQGYGRGLSFSMIEKVNSIAVGELLPEVVFLLDLPVSEGLRRARSRHAALGDNSWTRFEEEELSFHEKIRHGFLEIAAAHKHFFVTLDATQSTDSILSVAMRHLEHRGYV